MAESKAKNITEVKAYARGIHVPPRKARLVARLLKDLPVGEALSQLSVLAKKAALPIKKLIDSAIANASHNFQIESERLFIKNLSVDGGRVYFRYSPRAQGRALPVRKRTSHFNLILGVSATPLVQKRIITAKPKKIVAKELTAEEKQITPSEPQVAPPKRSRFAFWRKKKAEDDTQVPQKQDPKGKHYTSFDRRGNM